MIKKPDLFLKICLSDAVEVYFSKQAEIFLYAVITGAVISLIYDIFRIIRVAIKHGTLLTAIEDISFSIISLIVTLIYFIQFNNGTLRLYLAIGIICGFIICHYTLGNWILSFSRIIISFIKAILRLISMPFKWILKIICKLFKKICIFLKKPFIFLKKQVIIYIKSLFKKFKGGKRVGKSKQQTHKRNNKNSIRHTRNIPSVYINRLKNRYKRKKRRTGNARRKSDVTNSRRRTITKHS